MLHIDAPTGENQQKMDIDANVMVNILLANEPVGKFRNHIIHSDARTFKLQNLNVKGEVVLRKISVRGSIWFENCTFDSAFTFAVRSGATGFVFGSCKFQLFECRDTEVPFLHLSACSAQPLRFIGGNYKGFYVGMEAGSMEILGGNSMGFDFYSSLQSKLDTIIVDFAGAKGKFNISHANVSTFRVKGIIDSGSSLTVAHLNAHHLFIDNVVATGLLRFNNINADNAPNNKVQSYSKFLLPDEEKAANLEFSKSIFSIYESALTNCEFNTIFLDSFKDVNISLSNISDVKFSNMQWPKKIGCYEQPTNTFWPEKFAKGFKLGKLYHVRQRETYRQLKYSTSKQSDFVSEQLFHGLEMRSYNRSLSWHSEPWTKLVLSLSYITSNFGQSIWRPLLSLITVSALIYFTLSFSGATSVFNPQLSSMEGWVSTFAEIIEFANPFHKYDQQLTGISYLADLLMRIIASYLLYNLIRASRRFVR